MTTYQQNGYQPAPQQGFNTQPYQPAPPPQDVYSAQQQGFGTQPYGQQDGSQDLAAGGADEFDALLSGGGVPVFSFQAVGDRIEGVVVDKGTAPEREWVEEHGRSDGPVKRFKDGTVIQQLVLTLQTSLRDPDSEDDDGRRRVFVTGKRAKDAFRDAVRAAGAAKVEIGGHIQVQRGADEELPRDRKAHTWSIAYQTPHGQSQPTAQPPAFNQQAPQPTPTQQPPAAPQPQPQAPAVAQLTPEQLAAIQAQLNQQQG